MSSAVIDVIRNNNFQISNILQRLKILEDKFEINNSNSNTSIGNNTDTTDTTNSTDTTNNTNSNISNDTNNNISNDTINYNRNHVLNLVCKYLGITDCTFGCFPDNKMDSIPLLKIVKRLEKLILKLKPKTIYTHFSDDLNKDHKITFEAVNVACRPINNCSVKKIISFEILSSTEWKLNN